MVSSYNIGTGHSFLLQPALSGHGFGLNFASHGFIPGLNTLYNIGFGSHGFMFKGENGLDLVGNELIYKAPYYGYSADHAPAHGYIFGSFFGR